MALLCVTKSKTFWLLSGQEWQLGASPAPQVLMELQRGAGSALCAHTKGWQHRVRHLLLFPLSPVLDEAFGINQEMPMLALFMQHLCKSYAFSVHIHHGSI